MKKRFIIIIQLFYVFLNNGHAIELKEVASGLYHTLMLFDNGTIMSVGNNSYGQLGNGKKNQENSKKKKNYVKSKNKFISIAAGYNHSLAVSEDGTLWGWGSNKDLQLGDIKFSGRKDVFYIPIKINNESNWKKVFADGNVSFAIKNDGSLWNISDNKEIKNQNNAKWKDLKICTYFFLDDFIYNIVLKDDNNDFWLLSISDEDSFSCFSLLNIQNTESIYLSKLDIDSKTQDFSMNSYSGYYNSDNDIKLWGASIISEDMIMKKYFEGTSLDFYKWLKTQSVTIMQKNIKKIIHGSFISDIYFLSELQQKKINNDYTMLNSSYTLILQEDGSFTLWTNGKKLKNNAAIKIKNIYGNYNLVLEDFENNLYIIGYNFFDSLGEIEENNNNDFKQSFIFLKSFFSKGTTGHIDRKFENTSE